MCCGTIEHKQSNLIQRPIKDVTESNHKDVIESNQKTTDVNVTDSNHTIDVDKVAWCEHICQHSSHRDGTIYKYKLYWKNNYQIDVTNREESKSDKAERVDIEVVNGRGGSTVSSWLDAVLTILTWYVIFAEARVEPKRYSMDTGCIPNPENCLYHLTCQMVQIFSLKLAKTTINSGPLQLYGYIAARDLVDDMLNYVFNRSRDDPIIVQEESIIEMTGPKRGIALIPDVLFEFDMRIKNGDEEDDLQLIDGIIEFQEILLPEKPTTVRITGDYGDVDMCLANVSNGVEATVEVAISEPDHGFDLSISCVHFMMEKSKEFHLFGGTIGESRQLRRFVMAVFLDTVMHLKFKVDQKGSNVVEHCCSFESKLHGCASHQIKLENASILVKVTWSPLIE
uniref:DUF6598 domain-containing protein n=1 Tax=Oryza barthii TaxID=65489 RepID=A0A0D3FDA1_9ORYZ